MQRQRGQKEVKRRTAGHVRAVAFKIQKARESQSQRIRNLRCNHISVKSMSGGGRRGDASGSNAQNTERQTIEWNDEERQRAVKDEVN